ncbi:growth inhibitor PemK [Oleomonas cavernae]|uniref:Growth inhibitor PemK n=1 Tax=Oleomonas cavernae TaxID=2320859 RepID=A0A418VU71_9PROT|nr:type II toxin-antitoxin system PemK/MazF family toxin [Oleomonas cavernae]RJF80695.1 growth inhibitor PemK [Oleomonas cavernae]
MEIPAPKVGHVIAYAYVWRQEYAAGQREGAKNRPCAIVLATARDNGGRLIVTVAPITHTPPSDPAAAVEIWPLTKKRLGLDGNRSWVIVDDLNVFTWPGFDLQPVPQRPETCLYGPLPGGLIRQIRAAIARCYPSAALSDRDV